MSKEMVIVMMVISSMFLAYYTFVLVDDIISTNRRKEFQLKMIKNIELGPVSVGHHINNAVHASDEGDENGK